MITNITNVVEMGIVYRLVKGEILKKRKNPWIRGFLKYLQEHPKANAEDICRDVFCDNGMARKAAVKNILYFFKQQGLIAYSNSSGYELTQEGLNAFESGSVWQGMKGSFVMTMWAPENSKPFILDIQPVHDSWYDNGRGELSDFEEQYNASFEELELCTDKVKIVEFGKLTRPAYVHSNFLAKVKTDGQILIKGTPFEKTGFEPYEVRFKISKELLEQLCPEEDEDF